MVTNLNDNECVQVLSNNYIGQLGYIYIDRPFVIPMTYFFDKENNSIVGYSEDGHKTMAMRNYRKVSLQVSEKKNDHICNSILVHGIYEELSGSGAKKHLHEFSAGIKELISKKEHKNLHCISDFSHKINTKNTPIVFKIIIDEITGKKITSDNS
ncbi:pyridoxamine 5'-phosphate oxidase family protein [Polaribacter sp. L3A8]|uniref:pyridoxamine 5'-phosphate oxidase family protein n=1 Tax=Polaribacter sp. L3A8 TaxID=2686361 RepID=UPI00131B3929|nr:pyridoxamine 5'-phosphate oxidase family protein [Polaribacter sp. L3A8]